jgi:8-oxo-dGTP diphosphatase
MLGSNCQVPFFFILSLFKFKKINDMKDQDKYCYDYPRPGVTADCILFSKSNNKLHVLLIERGNIPFIGMWAFPGGFLEEDETIEMCASRELQEETGLKDIRMEQFYTFTEPKRDPRGRTISVAFIAFIDMEKHKPVAADDAANIRWFSVDSLPHLAFDHDKIIEKALNFINSKVIA